MLEESVFKGRGPAGEFEDLLLDPRGRVVWERPWQHNLIVDSMRKMLAALVKGDAQGQPIAFWAVGTGDPAWDGGTVPSDATLRGRAALFTETARKPVPAGQVKFLGGSFTNQLEISLDWTSADIPGGPATWQLREFGLFAGGTAAANSGVLLNFRPGSSRWVTG
jgi:hypothetical protein